MAKQQSRLVGALAKVPTGKLPGRVYAGGTPYFDERTGKRTAPTQSPQMGPPLTQAPQMQRVSPGVYRNQQGGLVNSSGGSLPGQQPQRPSVNVPQPHRMPMGPGNQMSGIAAGAAAGMGAAFGNKPYMFPKPELPFEQYMHGNPGLMYAGGSPNFNESTGQYAPAQQQMWQPQYAPYQSQVPQQYAALLAQEQAYAQQMGQRQPYNQQQQAQQPQQGIVASSPGTPNNGNIY